MATGAPSTSAPQSLLEESEVLSARERVAIVALATAYRRLVRCSPGRPDTQSEKGLEACGRFLRTLEGTAQTVGLEPAARAYREDFTANYRALFESGARSYRVDILEAGTNLDRHPVIWANGEAYEMSGDAMRCSGALQEAWALLCGILDAWIKPSQPFHVPTLLSALDGLDAAWAGFERVYIAELMRVQLKARGLVAKAVKAERRLAALEGSRCFEELRHMPAYQAEKRALVACVARLNSVANFQRKGRDDLTVAILDAAVDLLDECERQHAATGHVAALAPARVLAEQVVDAFDDLREYLRHVEQHLDLLHPQLCQNPGLVARLVRWEESWEVGARYLQNDEVLGALCYLVPELQRACRIAPALAELCEDFDAELFLVLPRLVWLCLLADPARPSELVRRLLPHRFVLRSGAPIARCTTGGLPRLARRHSDPDLAAAGEASRGEEGLWMGPELQALMERFWHAELLVARSLSASQGGASSWEVFVRRAVSGTGATSDPYACLEGGHLGEAALAVEELLHELEGWSIELQRHCPEDWNESVNVLVQCLARGHASKAPSGFSI